MTISLKFETCKTSFTLSSLEVKTVVSITLLKCVPIKKSFDYIDILYGGFFFRVYLENFPEVEIYTPFSGIFNFLLI